MLARLLSPYRIARARLSAWWGYLPFVVRWRAGSARLDAWWASLPFVLRWRAWWKQHPTAAYVVEMIGLLLGLVVQVWKFAVAWGLTTWLIW